MFNKSTFFLLLLSLTCWSKLNNVSSNANTLQAIITVHEGKMVFDLKPKQAPKIVQHFLETVKKGFFSNQIFNIIIQGSLAQTENFYGQKLELSDKYTPPKCPVNSLAHNAGAIAMKAEEGVVTNNFYITHTNQFFLSEQGCVFGNIVEGMDVLTRLEKGDPILNIKIQEK